MTSMVKLDPLEQGYYSMLNLLYTCKTDDIHDMFEKYIKELQSSSNVLSTSERRKRFQIITTAHQVLSDVSSRLGYDRVIMLRYYLHQQIDFESNIIHPHLIFSVLKLDGRGNNMQRRLLRFDFIRQEFTNWRKDELRKSFSFSNIKAVERNIEFKPKQFRIQFHEYKRAYQFCAPSVRLKNVLVQLFTNIIANKASFVVLDDKILPAKSNHKGFVEKRGNSGLQYSQRFAVLGTSCLLLFRKPICQDLVSCIHLHAKEVEIVATQYDAKEFTITTPTIQYKLRCESVEETIKWVELLTSTMDDTSRNKVTRKHRKQSSVPYINTPKSPQIPSQSLHQLHHSMGELLLTNARENDDDEESELSVVREISISNNDEVQDNNDDDEKQEFHKQLDDINALIELKTKELKELCDHRNQIYLQLGKSPPGLFQKAALRIGDYFRSISSTQMI